MEAGLCRMGSVPLLLATVAVALQGANKFLLTHVHVLWIAEQGQGLGLFFSL
jgi:hypothetical protein